MRVLGLLLALLIATPLSAQAQLQVVGVRDLSFGYVIAGVPTTVTAADPVQSGLFSIAMPGGFGPARLNLTLVLPTRLINGAGKTMPIAFGKNDGLIVEGNKHTKFDPGKAKTYNPNNKSTQVDVHLGGTVSPVAGQAPGAYQNTVILWVVVL
jgi:hypothetical protein